MQHRFLLCLSFITATLFMLFAEQSLLLADNPSIRGKVIDKQTRAFLPGTTVSLVPETELKTNELLYAFQGARASLNMLAGENATEQKYGAISGANGTFEIKNVKTGNYVMTTRYIGYKKIQQTIRIEADKNDLPQEFTQELIPDPQGIEEIVVTGLASRTAKELAEVAVGRVDVATLTDNVQFSNPLQTLVGKIPGIFLQFSNGVTASGVRFNVRSGASLVGQSPVIFIDGVRSSGVDYSNFEALQLDEISPLATLAPNDIETIEILKGPAASCLYGTSGQNGVVMITTKRGKVLSTREEANPFRINYRFSGGVQEAHRGFSEELTLNAANANRILRVGGMFSHQLSLQGGIGSTVNYYASFVQRNETGILPGNDAQQTSFRFNADIQPLSGLQMKVSAAMTNDMFNMPIQNENGGIFYSWIRNTLAGNPTSGQRFFLIDSASIAAIQNGIEIAHFLGSADISYIPTWLPNLKIRALVAMEKVQSRAVEFRPPGFPYSIDPSAALDGGYRSIRNFNPLRLNADANASYTTEFVRGLSTSLIAGLQVFDNRFLLDYSSATQFTSQFIPAIQTGSQGKFNGEIQERQREAGIFLRAESNYEQTFFLSGGIRNDYATAIGRTSTSVVYSQGSFAVRLDKLGFPPEVNLFKIRGGYGEGGKLPPLRVSNNYFLSQPGIGTSLTGNPIQLLFGTDTTFRSIRPERVQEFEFGADIEINSCFGGEFTGFYQVTRDALLTQSVGFPSLATSTGLNGGSLRSWGVEGQIYGRVISSQDVTLQLNVVASYTDNIVDSLINPNTKRTVQGDGRSFYGGTGFIGATNFIIRGERRGQFMGAPPVAPRFLPTGYYDWARGPMLDTVRRSLGSSIPLATGSFSWTLTLFRDVTFYGLIDAGLGRYIFNSTRQMAVEYGSNARFNTLATQLGLARGQTAEAIFGSAAHLLEPFTLAPMQGVQTLQPNTPAYRAASEEFMRLDPRFGAVANYVERADWIRLRELSLCWNARNSLATLVTLPEVIRTLKLGVSVRNAYLWTTYSGAETEVNAPANIPSRSAAQATDLWSLMQARAVNMNIEIGF